MLVTNPNFSINSYFECSREHREWYESPSHHVLTPEFLEVARRVLPLSWTPRFTGVWTYVSPQSRGNGRRQGWKIHVSAIPENCLKILERSIQVCVDYQASLKFLSSPSIFSRLLGKGSFREASGKFITIYPSDDSQFLLIMEALYEQTSEFKGSYTLSDKPYKDSQVLFYRYGVFSGHPQLSVLGHQDILLRSPEGELVPDGRSAYFNPPDWASDPLGEDTEETDAWSETTIYLKEGRYRVEEAIHFSLTGGVYKAVDMDTGKTVIIKEARPHTSIQSNGDDAIARLKKEHRLLTKLSGTGITPEPIDLFFDWTHLFLVEEFLPGNNLYKMISSLSTDGVDKNIRIESIHKLGVSLAYAVKVAHDHNIIINDFSPGNVIFSDAEETYKLIDLEAAWEEGVDASSVSIRTIGYQSPKGVKNKFDDLYGLSAIISSVIAPINSLLDLQPKAKEIFLEVVEKEGHISNEIKTLLLKCLDADKAFCGTASEFFNRFENISIAATPEVPEEGFGISDPLLSETVNQSLNYIKSNMDFQRTDRLFPADPEVFTTNPLSVANGAAGVAHALYNIEGEASDKVISWMLTREISKETYPPGLYVGLSGIAWVFWKLGQKELALKLMKMAADHDLLWDLSDIYYGTAGFGLACLYFYKETGDAYWLEKAADVGEKLIQRKNVSDTGFYWPDLEGNVWTGYARGASGISVFLLYLYLASDDTQFLGTGRRALDYDLGAALELEGKLRMPRATADSIDLRHQKVYSHYWSDGSTGVCTALLRYISVLGEKSDKAILERLMGDTRRDKTAFPTLFTGLAGLGNLQLDAFDFTGDPKYISSARYVTRGLLRFQIQKPDGIAFPGEQLLRISNDFGSGSAGIACFLHRLQHAEKHLPNFNFMLDELIKPKN